MANLAHRNSLLLHPAPGQVPRYSDLVLGVGHMGRSAHFFLCRPGFWKAIRTGRHKKVEKSSTFDRIRPVKFLKSFCRPVAFGKTLTIFFFFFVCFLESVKKNSKWRKKKQKKGDAKRPVMPTKSRKCADRACMSIVGQKSAQGQKSAHFLFRSLWQEEIARLGQSCPNHGSPESNRFERHQPSPRGSTSTWKKIHVNGQHRYFIGLR